jgi:5-methylcytosine-specific restriction endonuclease McrA
LEYEANIPAAAARVQRYNKKFPEKRRLRLNLWRAANPGLDCAYAKKYRNQNPSKYRLKDRARYWSDPEKAKARARDYTLRNPGKSTEANKIWKKKNPQKTKAYDSAKYARKARAKGTCTAEQWYARVSYFGWRCRFCKVVLNLETLTMDHAIPLSRNGTGWSSNLGPACVLCNGRKWKKTLLEFDVHGLEPPIVRPTPNSGLAA